MTTTSPAFRLADKTRATLSGIGLSFESFNDLGEFVRSLPYGRPSSPDDPLPVLRERLGTCSTKHQLLSMAAREAGQGDIKLTVGIFLMTKQNTPGVAEVLRQTGLAGIPEAHCYLKFGSCRYDYTGLASGETSPFSSLQEKFCVELEQLHRAKRAAQRTSNESLGAIRWPHNSAGGGRHERRIVQLTISQRGLTVRSTGAPTAGRATVQKYYTFARPAVGARLAQTLGSATTDALPAENEAQDINTEPTHARP